MTAFIAPILGGALLTAIAAFFQDRSAKLRHRREFRARELENARALFEAVSTTLGNLLHANEEAMYGAVLRDLQRDNKTPDEQDKLNWSQYQDALRVWKRTRTLLRGQVTRYFNTEVEDTFAEIYGEDRGQMKGKKEPTATGLLLLERMVNVSYFKAEGHADALRKTDETSDDYYQTKYFAAKNPIEDKVTLLATLMTQQIQEETIGMLDKSRNPKK